MSEYMERYISYLTQWQKDNIKLKNKLGYEKFFIRSYIEAKKNVPVTNWERAQSFIDEYENKYVKIIK